MILNEKEFNDLAQHLIADENNIPPEYIKVLMRLMWRAYNKGIDDYIRLKVKR